MNGRVSKSLRRMALNMINSKSKIFEKFKDYSIENKYKEINFRQKNFKVKDKVIPIVTSTFVLDNCHRKLYKTLKKNYRFDEIPL